MKLQTLTFESVQHFDKAFENKAYFDSLFPKDSDKTMAVFNEEVKSLRDALNQLRSFVFQAFLENPEEQNKYLKSIYEFQKENRERVKDKLQGYAMLFVFVK